METKNFEPDTIGGQGPLLKEEELAISKYLADKKAKAKREADSTPKKKQREKTT